MVQMIAGAGELVRLPGDGHLLAKSDDAIWERLEEFLPPLVLDAPRRLTPCRAARRRRRTSVLLRQRLLRLLDQVRGQHVVVVVLRVELAATSGHRAQVDGVAAASRPPGRAPR